MTSALSRLEARLTEEFRQTFSEAQRLEAESERLGKRRLDLEDELHAIAKAMDLARRVP